MAAILIILLDNVNLVILPAILALVPINTNAHLANPINIFLKMVAAFQIVRQVRVSIRIKFFLYAAIVTQTVQTVVINFQNNAQVVTPVLILNKTVVLQVVELLTFTLIKIHKAVSPAIVTAILVRQIHPVIV